MIKISHHGDIEVSRALEHTLSVPKESVGCFQMNPGRYPQLGLEDLDVVAADCRVVCRGSKEGKKSK